MNKLKANYNSILQRIESAAVKAGRDPSFIRLVAVTKYATADQIQAAYDLGLRDFAESRVQEALIKKETLPQDIRWHFIGRIQSNKINKVIGEFYLIHSVADIFTARALSEKSSQRGLSQSILLQVNLSQEESKQGFSEKEIIDEWNLLSSFPHLCIEGLMTMAPLVEDKIKCSECFSGVLTLKNALEARGATLPVLSMGMSGDFETAIQEGSTLIRIGSGLFT